MKRGKKREDDNDDNDNDNDNNDDDKAMTMKKTMEYLCLIINLQNKQKLKSTQKLGLHIS